MDNVNRSALSCPIKAVVEFVVWRAAAVNGFKIFRSEVSINSAAQCLDNIDPTHWVKYNFQEAFYLPTYNEIASTLMEQANHWVSTELRSAKPVDGILLYVIKFSKLMPGWLQTGPASAN